MLAFELIIFNLLKNLMHLNLTFDFIRIHFKFDYIQPCKSALLHNFALIVLFILNYQESCGPHQIISIFSCLFHFNLSYFFSKIAQNLNEHFKESDLFHPLLTLLIFLILQFHFSFI